MSTDALIITCCVDDVNVDFEIDTGSHLSTINVRDVDRIKNCKILPTSKKAKGYGQGIVKFLGETNLVFECNGISMRHTFLVVGKKHVSLLGRDLCSKMHIQMVFPKFNDVSVNHVNYDVLTKFKNYLSDDFKSNVQVEVKLHVNTDVQPIFCKARSTPLRYRTLVKEELERLDNCGVISKVFRSNWACPTVNVLKKCGKIRICGDYSLTINKCMNIVQYPLPSIEDVLGKVCNAQFLSKNYL